MHEWPGRASPLVERRMPSDPECRWSGRGVLLLERPFLAHINLRGDPRDRAFRTAVESIVGCPVPVEENTYATHERRCVFWLGPLESLVVAPAEDEVRLDAALRSALTQRRAAVTNVGHGQTTIRIAGPGARDVLARGCPLDLHPRAFGAGRCAQSRFAKAPLLVALVDAAPTFDVVVRRSFAEYLWDMLVDSGASVT